MADRGVFFFQPAGSSVPPLRVRRAPLHHSKEYIMSTTIEVQSHFNGRVYGQLALEYCGKRLSLQILRSNAGFTSAPVTTKGRFPANRPSIFQPAKKPNEPIPTPPGHSAGTHELSSRCIEINTFCAYAWRFASVWRCHLNNRCQPCLAYELRQPLRRERTSVLGYCRPSPENCTHLAEHTAQSVRSQACQTLSSL